MEKKYSRKPFGGPKGTYPIYQWKPYGNDKKRIKKKGGDPLRKCSAVAGSVGKNAIDNVVGYVYSKQDIDGIIQKLAYVECGYVR